MQVVLERGNESNWFHSSWITAGAIMTVLMLTTLVFWELRTHRADYQFSCAAQYPAEYRCGDGLALWGGSLWYDV